MKIHGVLIALVIAGTIPPALAASGTPTGVNLTYAQPLSTPAIRDVQKRLHKLGVYKGSIDGNWGSSSQAALKQFQQTHGLQATGQLNDATVKTLNVNLAKLLGISPPKSTPNGHWIGK